MHPYEFERKDASDINESAGVIANVFKANVYEFGLCVVGFQNQTYI